MSSVVITDENDEVIVDVELSEDELEGLKDRAVEEGVDLEEFVVRALEGTLSTPDTPSGLFNDGIEIKDNLSDYDF